MTEKAEVKRLEGSTQAKGDFKAELTGLTVQSLKSASIELAKTIVKAAEGRPILVCRSELMEAIALRDRLIVFIDSVKTPLCHLRTQQLQKSQKDAVSPLKETQTTPRSESHSLLPDPVSLKSALDVGATLLSFFNVDTNIESKSTNISAFTLSACVTEALQQSGLQVMPWPASATPARTGKMLLEELSELSWLTSKPDSDKPDKLEKAGIRTLLQNLIDSKSEGAGVRVNLLLEADAIANSMQKGVLLFISIQDAGGTHRTSRSLWQALGCPQRFYFTGTAILAFQLVALNPLKTLVAGVAQGNSRNTDANLRVFRVL